MGFKASGYGLLVLLIINANLFASNNFLTFLNLLLIIVCKVSKNKLNLRSFETLGKSLI